MASSKEDIQAKIERVHANRMQIEAFVAAGGDLKSKEAVPLGIELTKAFHELSAEFGHPTLEDVK